MNINSLKYNTFYFRNWTEKSTNKFFDMLKKENIVTDKNYLAGLSSGIYSD